MSKFLKISSILIIISLSTFLLLKISKPKEKHTTPEPQNKVVKVFILMGQSNMLGFGRVQPETTLGTLAYFIKNKKKYLHLVDANGNWVQHKTVRYVQKTTGNINEWLTVQGKTNIGPEIQFGHVIARTLKDQPVLLLKACIGNRALGWDLLPPGSQRFTFNGKVYAGYKDKCPSWPVGQPMCEIDWYAGKQYDIDTGNAKEVLKNLSQYYPGHTSYEITGFVWWQGHKDQLDDAWTSRYEHNLVNIIKELRKDFRAPNAKFALASIAFEGYRMTGRPLKVLEAQLAVDGNKGKYPEFRGNVRAFDARPFWRESDVSPGGGGHHYHGNAETYMEVGNSLGNVMSEMLR